MKFADPTNGFAFKKIFANSKYKNILISFLNSTLGFEGEKKIKSIDFERPSEVPKISDLKDTILDVFATNEQGDEFIVEMQKKHLGDFAKRSMFYTAKSYVNQLPKGGSYSNLNKIYFVGILDFELFKGKNFITRHLIINQETGRQDLKDFEFTFIELAKFQKELLELSSILDKWIYFIKNAGDLTVIPKEFKSLKDFKDAFVVSNQASWQKKEMDVYDYVNIKAYDEVHALDTAKKEGIQEGIEKGIEKGKKEEKIEIAKNLLKANLDFESIAKATGLTIEEIKNL